MITLSGAYAPSTPLLISSKNQQFVRQSRKRLQDALSSGCACAWKANRSSISSVLTITGGRSVCRSPSVLTMARKDWYLSSSDHCHYLIDATKAKVAHEVDLARK